MSDQPGPAPEEAHAPYNSQQALALSIARAIRLDLPDAGAEDLPASIEQALIREAQRNETTIAGVRAAMLVAGAVLIAAATTFDRVPLANAAFLGVGAIGGMVLYRELRGGWYHAVLRRAVPTADAVLITGSFVMYSALRDDMLEVPASVMAGAATACVFLAFSGALRLSRSAARLATVLAIGAWLCIIATQILDGAALGDSVLAAAFVTAALAATGYLGSDITRMIKRVVRNEVERERLTRLYDDARHAIEAREEVLRVVSHDLRNPLNTIGMTAELLMEMDLPAEQRNENLARIRRAGDRMNRLIHDLLDVARMESGKLSVKPEPVSCAELLADAAELMAPLVAERQQQLRVVCAPEAPDVRIDRDRALQVFSNLIGNAIKFTPPTGTICVSAEVVGPKVRFSVRDSGPGIPGEQLREIFSRLWQADPSDRRGLGLGLAIARSIVEAHGEQIDVDSKPGEGATFWFTAAPVAS